MEKRNIIREKSFEFALETIDLYKKMLAEKEYVISNQILRAATSVGANVEEAIAGASRKDFIYKLVIAQKEARESCYWLKLLQKSTLVSINVSPNLNKADEIVRILTAIVKTSQTTN
ncbi:MAG: four helix bundle protein [Bacteroidetes bacterium]|nr:four helix bundle protein [Bacteroidota bacterium]